MQKKAEKVNTLRRDVFVLINDEREYQDHMHQHLFRDDPCFDENHSVADWIIYIEKLLNDAKQEIYNLDEVEALSHIRKIAALCVACMEYNKTPKRKQ
jgi:hypothetical protein